MTHKFAAAALVVLIGCGEAKAPPVKLPDVTRVFPHLPLPPRAELVSRAGSADALQITMRSDVGAAAVTEFYRKSLSAGRWRLVSDLQEADGAVVLYAEREGRPIWVRIWGDKEASGTLVQLSGAVIDGDTARARQSGSSMTSKQSRGEQR